MTSARRVTSFVILSIACLLPQRANAQLHWDASAQVGVMKRFMVTRAGDDAGFGPTGQLAGHLALLPLVHVGGYFGHDLSPVGDDALRNTTFGGLRVKGMIPWVHGKFRAWIFTGFGYAGVYAQSYPTTVQFPTGLGTTEPRAARVEGAGGSYFEVPLGIGASYKLYKPWELCAEVGTRFGFGHTGSVYEAPGPQLTVAGANGSENVTTSQNAAAAGLDRFALGLTVGVLIDL